MMQQPKTASRVRLFVVTSIPEERAAIQNYLSQLENVEVVGVAYNARAALQQLKDLQVDVLLVDVMLLGLRSVQLISYVSATQPDVKVLALCPGDPPHDRVILALQAGALGYVCLDAEPTEISAAIQKAFRGDHHLPLETTYEILQEAAPELQVSAREKRGQLVQLILGLIPIAGLVAAVTGFLWREYWGQIGVRVVDLGVDASTRVTEFMLTFFVIVGILGPLLFVGNWRNLMASWLNRRPAFRRVAAKARSLRLGPLPIGRLLFNPSLHRFVLAALVLAISIPLDISGGRMLTILIGAMVGVLVVANLVGLGEQLPKFLRLQRHDVERALVIDGFLFIALVVVLSVEVFHIGPDLRKDGLHSFLAGKVLDLSAKPVTVYDLDEKYEPLAGALPGRQRRPLCVVRPLSKRWSG